MKGIGDPPPWPKDADPSLWKTNLIQVVVIATGGLDQKQWIEWTIGKKGTEEGKEKRAKASSIFVDSKVIGEMNAQTGPMQ